MKFSITKESLDSSGLSQLRQVIPTKASDSDLYKDLSMEVLDNLLTLEGFSTRGFIRVLNSDLRTVWSPGKVHIPFGPLDGLLKTLDKKDEIIFDAQEEKVSVSVLRGTETRLKAALHRKPSDFDFYSIPDVDPIESITVEVEALKPIFAIMDRSNYEFQYRGLYFQQNMVFGGTQNMFAIQEQDHALERSYSLDPTGIDVIDRFETAQFEFGEDYCKVSNESDTVLFYARYLVQDPPPLEGMLNLTRSGWAEAEKKELLEVLKSAQSLTSESSRACLFELTGDQVTVRNRDKQKGDGEFYGKMAVGKEFAFQANSIALYQAVSAVPQDTVILHFNGDHGHLTVSGGISIVMTTLSL